VLRLIFLARNKDYSFNQANGAALARQAGFFVASNWQAECLILLAC
jgi:hypothetical protein